MDDAERHVFDEHLVAVLNALPKRVHELLEEVPLVVEDFPADDVAEAFDLEYRDELCGLHDGIPLTERSVEDSAVLPEQIMIYREGIVAMAADDDDDEVDVAELRRQIRITILHEVGHHFGLTEEQLADLGYD